VSIQRLDNRLIGFLDILGFSQRLESSTLESIDEIYNGLIEDANSNFFDPPTREGSKDPILKDLSVSRFMFDSVVLVSEDITENRYVNNFIGGVIHLMESAYVRQLPIRGCVGVGDVLIDDSLDVILSPVFPKLVRLEKTQD